jgi:hypothetical protein
VQCLNEIEVLKQAAGGEGKKTAYWVLYISSEELDAARKYNLHDVKQNTLYQDYIDIDLFKFVEGKNQTLLKEYHQHLEDKLVKEIHDSYVSRVQDIRRLF